MKTIESGPWALFTRLLTGPRALQLSGPDRRISLINSCVCIIGIVYFAFLLIGRTAWGFSNSNVTDVAICLYAIASTCILFLQNYHGKVRLVRFLWLANAMLIVTMMHITLFLITIYFHYITLAVGTVILFDYKERFASITLAVTSLFLFVGSSFYVATFYTPSEILTSISLTEFLLDFIFCFLTCVSIIFIHVRDGYHSKRVVAEEKNINTRLLDQLRYSSKKYEIISRSSSGMLLELDLNSRKIIADDRLFEYASFQTSPLTADELLKAVHKADRGQLLVFIKSASDATSRPKAISLRVKSRYGTYRWLEATASLFEESDRRVVFISLLDIHDKHMAEERIQEKNRELQKANEELDSFVYHTSHDIRSPICSILGLTHLAEKTNEVDELRAYMSMIAERANALERFIKNVMSYSDNARNGLHLQPVDIEKVIEQIRADLDWTLNQDRIVSISVTNQSTQTFITDLERIQVVLKQLILNSITFREETHQQSYVKVSITNTDQSFFILVEDNGIGIEATRLNKIFDMFYRATEKSKGSGIGLYIVKDIISKLNGDIYVRSSPGKGTLFTITLPINNEHSFHADRRKSIVESKNEVFMRVDTSGSKPIAMGL